MPITRTPSSFSASFESLEARTLFNTVIVLPGQSIQAALDAAPAGSTIEISPGTYSQSVIVNKPNIRIVGDHDRRTGGVILNNPGAVNNGIMATSAASGFEVDNLTVRGFNRNGVFLLGVNGFSIHNVTATNDGDYGLFPVRSSNGLIDSCITSGNSDTGIYVGQSSHIVVRNSISSANVFGFDIENCTDAQVNDCIANDNTIGIGAVVLPGLSVTTGSNVRLLNNLVFNNNHANFGDPADLASHVPSGLGILLLGVDNSTVAGNLVTGNTFAGIAVASTTLLALFAGLPPSVITGIDPNPDNDTIRNNIVIGNGTQPVPGFGAADLLWDGSGTNDHWRNNLFGTSSPSPLP